MLHAGQHGSPDKSDADAAARQAAEHIIIAESSVLNADRAIRRLTKPCVVRLRDSVVVEVRVDHEFDPWVAGHKLTPSQ